MSFLSRSLLVILVAFASVITLDAQKNPDSNSTPAPADPSPAPLRISFNYVHVDGTYIAMTFDDGPSEKLTPKLLDLLAAHNIKATFFVIGENLAEHPEIVSRAAREGHEIGNHSWS